LEAGGNYFGSGTLAVAVNRKIEWATEKEATVKAAPSTARASYPRDDAAAVNAMASGSQHNTMSAISHRIARSLSAPHRLGT
jgi:hypothetical protein